MGLVHQSMYLSLFLLLLFKRDFHHNVNFSPIFILSCYKASSVVPMQSPHKTCTELFNKQKEEKSYKHLTTFITLLAYHINSVLVGCKEASKREVLLKVSLYNMFLAIKSS